MKIGLSFFFPASEILSLACIGTANYHGYSLSSRGRKVITKSLSSDNGFYLDMGEFLEEEHPIYAKSELVEGRRVWRNEDLSNEVFYEDQLMVDFTFEVAKRLLGVRIDSIVGEELLENTIFRKYGSA